jgi:K+ transporter
MEASSFQILKRQAKRCRCFAVLPYALTRIAYGLEFQVATGGWLPLSIATLLATVMFIWNSGRGLLIAAAKQDNLSETALMAMYQCTSTHAHRVSLSLTVSVLVRISIRHQSVSRVGGLGLFFTRDGQEIPSVVTQLLHCLYALPVCSYAFVA